MEQINPNLERAQLLLSQNRSKEAVEFLQRALLDDPDDYMATSYLALTYADLEDNRAADQLIPRLVELEPDEAHTYYVIAIVRYQQNKHKEAHRAIDRALAIDPEDADFCRVKGELEYDRHQFKEALKWAENGLRIDPEDEDLNNLRAMALTKTGRRGEAFQTLDKALSDNPDNAQTHANKGWALLHDGEYKLAMESFREALRLEPDNEYAREGIREAMNGQHFIYRIFLRYLLFMTRFPPSVQIGLIVGLLFLNRLIQNIGHQYPGLAPVAKICMFCYIAFVFLSWTAQPYFNLLLLLHPFGRHVLNRDERLASTLAGLSTLIAILCFVSIFFGGGALLLLTAALCLLMVIPISGALNRRPGKLKWALSAYTVALYAIGILAIFTPPGTMNLGTIFLFGYVAFFWIATFSSAS